MKILSFSVPCGREITGPRGTPLVLTFF